jgi:hypothetical protein
LAVVLLVKSANFSRKTAIFCGCIELRRIIGLEWAMRAENPHRRTRSSGTKAVGLAYERKLAAKLPKAEHNPWFMYKDKNGIGYCSPDFIWLTQSFRIILECKLANWQEAWEQLDELYIPVLSMVFNEPIIPIVMVKHVQNGCPIVEKITEAVAHARDKPVVHWIGRGPLQW